MNNYKNNNKYREHNIQIKKKKLQTQRNTHLNTYRISTTERYMTRNTYISTEIKQ